MLIRNAATDRIHRISNAAERRITWPSFKLAILLSTQSPMHGMGSANVCRQAAGHWLGHSGRRTAFQHADANNH